MNACSLKEIQSPSMESGDRKVFDGANEVDTREPVKESSI